MQVLRDEYSDLGTQSFEDYRRMVNAKALRVLVRLPKGHEERRGSASEELRPMLAARARSDGDQPPQ